MGSIELWLGSAGCGKTGRALHVLRETLARDWRAARYLVPTVGQKRSLEELLLQQGPTHGLLGDPVNIFFTFAREVAERARLRVTPLTDLQKPFVLQHLIRQTPLEVYDRAAHYAGFAVALHETIDELKVHMVEPGAVLVAAKQAMDQGHAAFAAKLREIGLLYQEYQTWVYERELFDNEGMMWVAANLLRQQPDLFAGLQCLILDGFARLTPIQVDFLGALSRQVERIIVLFDYEDGRTVAYHPIEQSINQLEVLCAREGIALERETLCKSTPHRTTLAGVRAELFRDRKRMLPGDASLGMFVGATAAHEAALIARDVRAVLRQGRLADGTLITPGDIAILARNADDIRDRLARTFRQYGLTVQPSPPALAHTALGRAILAVFRLVRNRWKREDVLMLLKSGCLAIAPGLALQIDVTARRHYLRDRRSSWVERWPEEATATALRDALAPVLAFDDAYQRQRGDLATILAALRALAAQFRAQALPDGQPPLPDVQPDLAQRRVATAAAFRALDTVCDDLERLNTLIGGMPRIDPLEVIADALARETVPIQHDLTAGISVVNVHATGGEKFKVVYLAGLLQGVFPRHVRESAFLMDHEREDTLRDLDIHIQTRKGLEEDERYWFLHALGTATHRVVLCYPQHDSAGNPLERSPFLDEVETLVPDLPARARRTCFSDLIPSLDDAESAEEYLAALALGLRTEREATGIARLTAAYAACPWVRGPESRLACLFRRAQSPQAALGHGEILAQLVGRTRPFSASELQAYADCPFLWFAGQCLAVEPIEEEFNPLDRGIILHTVLERFYRRHQRQHGEPVHVEQLRMEMVWPEVANHLHELLQEEPRHRNRRPFLQEIEEETLRRMLQRFLRREMVRAATYGHHPAFFEYRFGGEQAPLSLGDTQILLKGTIDRVDLADADPRRALLIDYKSSVTRITAASLKAGDNLQAGIYALALEHTLQLQPLGVEFMALRDDKQKGVYHEAVKALGRKPHQALDDAAWELFRAACTTRITASAHGIRAGQIPLAPTTKRCPKECPYLVLCRGDRFLLAKQRGAAGEE